jgi:hypothetical protein
MSLKLRCVEDNESTTFESLFNKQVAPDWWIARGLRSAAATATGMRRTNWLQSEYETLGGYQKQPEILD